MLHLQKNGKTIKTYNTTYQLAVELESVMPNRPEAWYKHTAVLLNRSAFSMAIIGAKITFGGGYRLICLPEGDGEKLPLGEVKIAKA